MLASFCALWSVTAAATTGETNSPVLARIALLADTHVMAVTNKRQASFQAHLVRATAEVNASRVDLVLVAGDLTDHGKPEEMAEFQKEIREFTAPVWFVPGNHDVGNKPGAGRVPVVTTESVSAFEKALGPSFFERERSGVRIIGINSSLLGSGLPKELEMWRFLEAKLAQTNGGPTLLLTHYPVFTKSAAEPASYYNIDPEARRRLLGLLPKGRVPAILCGHFHRPRENRLDGRLFLIAPAISFSLPAGAQDEGWTLVTVAASGGIRYEFKTLKR